MSAEQPLAIDFGQEDSPAQILPNLPLLTSHQSNWNSVHLAHHLQPAWELPEMASNQHIIFIPTTQKPASVEVCLEGRVQAVDFGLDEYAQGCFGILPAHLPFKMGWNVEAEFFHFYLDPATLSQIAHESINPDQVELLLEVKRFDSLIIQIALALRADLEGDGMGNGFYADSLATAMSAHLIQHYSTRKHIFRALLRSW
jgi:AraC family transcriptional regulator